MDNKKLYICVSLGSSEFYLTSYSEETNDVKLAAKCTSKSCAKILIDEYKKWHKVYDKKSNDLVFVVEEYN